VATKPASTSGGASSGGSSAGYSAVLNLKDSQGDTYTQTFTFGTPVAEAGVPAVVTGVQTCQLGVANPARNLVVPVQVTTALTTSIQTQIPIELNVSDFPQPGSNAGIPGVVIYQTTAGDQCQTNQPGAEVTLNQGQSVTTQAWMVLQDAITPAYPAGDVAQLGANFVALSVAGASFASVTSAQGSAVCTGDSQGQPTYSPPYLLFAGNAPSGEGCTGQYTAPPGS
jgi:hypothetical protein